MSSFYEIAFTPSVKQEQEKHGSRRQYQRMAEARAGEHKLCADETSFLSLRDSFYMASVSETGWPYVQHRGGLAGFVRVLSPALLAFADLGGNKQYISAGNLGQDNRVALFFMDYPNQTRLKILGRAQLREAATLSADELAGFPLEPGDRIEHVVHIEVEGFDWNCPQHITPRFTLHELEATLAPLRARMRDLEAENARLRQQAGIPTQR